jgi:hypothetical protein
MVHLTQIVQTLAYVLSVVNIASLKMTTHERAWQFVVRYPALFTEDLDFWVEKIEELLEQHENNSN